MGIGSKATAALSVAIIAVSSAGVATAASGGGLVGGHSNSEPRTTTIKSGHGAALSLKVKSGPALKVNSKAVVPNLDAQLLDGESAAQIGGTIQVVAQMSDFVGVATCPQGTHVSGGGVLPDPTGADDAPVVVGTFPHISGSKYNGWEGIASDGDGTYGGGGFVYAYCSTGAAAEVAQAAASHRYRSKIVRSARAAQRRLAAQR